MVRDKTRLYVMAKACNQCLYSKNKIVSDERKAQIIEDCARTERGFSCHKATKAGQDVMCRGHWDRTKADTLRNRLAVVWGLLAWVQESEFVKKRKE